MADEQEWREVMERQMSALSEEMRKNTEVTNEVRDILSTIRGGWRLLGLLGNLAKWGTAIVASVYTVWWAVHHGGDIPK